MIRTASRSFAAALAALLLSGAAQAAPPSEKDRAELAAVMVAADDAWNAKDADAMAGIYAEDGSIAITPNGQVFAGRETIRGLFTRNFAARKDEARHLSSTQHVDMLTPDLAQVDAQVRVEVKDAAGNWTLARYFVNTSVAVRQKDGWKIRTVRANLRPIEEAAKAQAAVPVPAKG
ncbi:MAG TPA: SgcJ/EcaC family oxidoreductase [Azospirillaceae bacterium]|nr:SgcJ/EcaC family oxidoreductase [Azospirillaceae bacterium]